MFDYRKLERIPRADSSLAAGGLTGVVTDAGRFGWLTYETYYGLREKPFSLTSAPRFFYHSQPHASAYEDLLAGIRRRESLSVLSGDIGTGKTTLCRAVLQSLDRQTFSAFVWDPFATREDLLKMVLMDFGVISVDDLTSGRLNGASRTELSYLLYEFLHKLAPLQAFAVVVIDEAQNLSMPLLEEIRILSDSDGRERQLQVILVGQLELREKLMLPELRQVEQRISVRCSLESLTLEGTAGYVGYRLQVADGTPYRVSFSEDGIDAVYQASRGVPRLINRICDRALHHGHLRRVAKIDGAIVQEAIADIGLNVTTRIAVETPSEPEPPIEGPEAPLGTVDVWLAALHVGSSPAETPVSPEIAPLPTLHFDPECFAVPRTHMQRVIRRWLRRLMLVALWAGGLAAAGLIVTFLSTAWELHVGEPLEPIALPAAPPISIRPAMTLPEPLKVDLERLRETGGYVGRTSSSQ